MKKNIFLSIAFAMLLCGTVFADVIVQNKSEGAIYAVVTDSRGDRKSVIIPTKERATFKTSQAGGKVEIQAVGNKQTGEVLGTVKFTTNTLLIITTDKNDATKVNIEKRRQY